MKKQKKRLSRKFKRTVGFTLAGLFLISAVIVALLPQRDVNAYTQDGDSKCYLEDSENEIPVIDDQVDKIYTDGNGFQFAYKNKNNSPNKIAIICGYDYQRALSGGNLTIPDTVDAYKKYTDSFGTSGGYVAVSNNDEPLFYPTYKTETVTTTTTDEEGNPVTVEEEVEVVDNYLPCYVETYNDWINDKTGNNKRKPEEFYYEANPGDYQPCIDQAHQRITNIEVNYIANQNVIANMGTTGGDWILSGDDTLGIFSKANNIVNITFGPHLYGIGNYAFRGCANVSSLTFNNGINTLGNYSFADCRNLRTVNLPTEATISVIGQKAFYNCQGLQKFVLPTAVTKLGDSCFEGCVNLTECVIDIPGNNMLLTEMGKNVFKNCTSLEYIQFPPLYTEDQDVAWFEGCTSLKRITIPNRNVTIIDSPDFSFEDFQKQLPEEFYLEGVKDEKLHKTSTANSFAFKYLNDEIYEKVYNTDKGKIVFQVNNLNELIFFEMDDSVEKVEIPKKIGPYNITNIGSDSFAGRHNLKQISIPSTITEISEGAFMGCHRLESVIFEEPINITGIGKNAFDTQTVDASKDSCNLAKKPSLSFVGNAKEGSVPFEYAMDPGNNINNGDQSKTYITFYTGWPTNLTIKYNSSKKTRELVDVPTMTSLSTMTLDSYPYMNQSYVSAAVSAFNDRNAGKTLTDNQKDIINAVLNVYIPDGVTSIKEGLFSGVDSEGKATGSKNTDIESITVEGVKKIDNYAFKDVDTLKGVYLKGSISALGDYAFEGCDGLVDVDISPNLTEFGKVPFVSCPSLKEVDFQNNPNFYCKDAIIYGQVNGVNENILEVLGSRGLPNGYGSGTILSSELKSVKTVAPEAFRDCDGILSVDFSESSVTEIPESCFENTAELYSVVLKDGNTKIGPKAFKDSNIRYVQIPNSTTFIDNSAFDGDTQLITFYAEPNTAAAYYADNHPNIIIAEKPIQYHVYFYDEDTTTLLDTQIVDAGQDAVTYITPTKPGYVFEGWYPAPVKVTSDMNTYAKYRPEDLIIFTVKFIDYDGSVFYTEEVESGKDCTLYKTIKEPSRDGYLFTGWIGNLTNVTENREVYAQYEKLPDDTFVVKFYDWDDTLLHTQTVKKGEDCIEVKEPVREGYKFTGWKPSIKNVTENMSVYAQYEKDDSKTDSDPSNDPDKKDDPDPNGDGENPDNDNTNKDPDNPNGNNNNNGDQNKDNQTLYTVTVVDGTGSGSYAAGANVIILANNPENGKVFDKWVADDGVSLLKAELAANYFTMPAKNVTVKATYKESGTNNPSNNNSSNNQGSTTSNVVTPNTTVTITKPGISNGGIASASVTGSSDNYVLKISESQTSKAEVEDALLGKYDSLSNIKYVAMDISLYDKTGSTKIENTSDLKVSVTMPIPDDLVGYAGNNKVAYVVNGKLVDLNPKFTTINNVPCINFVAPHFSPYTIYVDTSNLSSAVTYSPTSTPKTGDGLHAKWFISIGLFAASLIFFALCIPTGKKKKATAKVKR
ncbi:MAG: leucine-rich repeat protein [Lachnospiraceae bacterium]|nr:leucine-rich repeat protein [Lachnospiraceae bacterium]